MIAKEEKENFIKIGKGFYLPKRIKYVKKLGNGVYGIVIEGIDTLTGISVAIKKNTFIWNDDDEKYEALIREFNILSYCNHPNIITLIDVYKPPNDNPYFVTKKFEFDLLEVIKCYDIKIGIEHIKVIGLQILSALYYIHSSGILHGDIKPANILMNSDCTISLADFGYSRYIPLNTFMKTSKIASVWYRAPELLLHGTKLVNYSLDIWSCGCVLAELAQRFPLFYNNEASNMSCQFNVIRSIIGNPNETEIESMLSLHDPKNNDDNNNKKLLNNSLKKMPNLELQSLADRFDNYPNKFCDLLKKMFQYDPLKRISAEDAMKHEFFEKYYNSKDFLKSNFIKFVDYNNDMKDSSESVLNKAIQKYKESKVQ